MLLRSTRLAGLCKRLVDTNWDAGRFVCENYGHVEGLTLVDPFRMAVLVDIVRASAEVDGDIVECGSYKGGTGILMALALRQLGIRKQIHLFDSFQGLPEPHQSKDSGYAKGSFASDYDALAARIAELGLSGEITLHRGWFADTVPPFLNTNSKVSLLHIDCDLYASTMDSFPPLYARVPMGGAVVLDDFNDGGGGEKLAVLETLEGSDIVLRVGPAPQVHFFRGDNLVTGPVCRQQGVTYDFGPLLELSDYCAWLDSKMAAPYTARVMAFCAQHAEKTT
jgi:hypothetical protein